MYIVAVELSINNSFGIRKLLVENGFTVFFVNQVTKEIKLDKTNYGTNLVLVVPSAEAQMSRYHCIYNGEKKPKQELLERIDTDSSVIAYYIEKR